MLSESAKEEIFILMDYEIFFKFSSYIIHCFFDEMLFFENLKILFINKQ